MWRGLVLNRAVQQFLQDAHWGDLDYLLIDLPPGTGDVQMGLARLLPRTEMLVVTTPPLAAQKVAARAADMARKGYLRVAGVIENMSDFTCEHGTTYALFGSGGGTRLAHGLGVPLIGSIPLHPDLAAAGDAGTPVAEGDGELATHLRRAGPGGGRRGGAAARDVVVLGPPGRAGAGGRGQRRRRREQRLGPVRAQFDRVRPSPEASATGSRWCPRPRLRRRAARPGPLRPGSAGGPRARTGPPGAAPR